MYPNIIEMGDKKGLKISKGQSESVKRRITYTTMTNRKRIKGHTTIYKTYTCE